jgi:hypothetical protein
MSRAGHSRRRLKGPIHTRGAYGNYSSCAAKNAVDLETDLPFRSAYRSKDIPHTRNNWICYDFKEKRIVPTHYSIRTHGDYASDGHLKSWLVETSADGKSWREVAREEDNKQFSGLLFAATFAVPGGGECRFIRLVNIGSNDSGNDCLAISAWEIIGGFIGAPAQHLSSSSSSCSSSSHDSSSSFEGSSSSYDGSSASSSSDIE